MPERTTALFPFGRNGAPQSDLTERVARRPKAVSSEPVLNQPHAPIYLPFEMLQNDTTYDNACIGHQAMLQRLC